MQLTQQFLVSHPPARVWAYLADVRTVARCLPGAEVVGVSDSGEIEGRMNVRFGPISAAFAGEATLSRDEAAMAGRIIGSGLDRQSRSRCKGDVGYRLSEGEDGGTVVDLEVDYTLTGARAQFGRGGLVNDLAQKLTADFAAALERALTDAGAETDLDAQSASPEPQNQALDAGGLLWAVVWGRIQAFCRRLLGRA